MTGIMVDNQILALLGFIGLLGLGFWLMFGRPGNRKPSDGHHIYDPFGQPTGSIRIPPSESGGTGNGPSD
jgi:hypothetical protein